VYKEAKPALAPYFFALEPGLRVPNIALYAKLQIAQYLQHEVTKTAVELFLKCITFLNV